MKKGPTTRWSRFGPGVRVRRLVDQEGTALALYLVVPGTRCDLHEHGFPELGMVLSGAGAITFDEGEQRVDTGDSFYLPARLRHGFRVPGEGPPVLMINVEAAGGGVLQPSVMRELPKMVREAGPLDPPGRPENRTPR